MSHAYYTPAQIGQPLSEVDTPALILDLDAFEHNLKLLNESLAGRNIKLRPHAKSHKCPEIGKRQMALGAVGVCCQKVSEAEAMMRRAGIRWLSTTHKSIEEIATTIIQEIKPERLTY